MQIYSVSVDSNFGYSKPSKTADLEGEMTIEFSCDPNVSSALVSVLHRPEYYRLTSQCIYDTESCWHTG